MSSASPLRTARLWFVLGTVFLSAAVTAFADCTEPDPNASVTHLFVGDHPNDEGTLNGSTSAPGNLDGRQRVCPDGNGGFIVTPLPALAGDNVEFRFFKNPPNSVSLDGPYFGMASLMMGDANYTGSLTANTVVIQNQEPPYPGADVAAKQSFNGVNIFADDLVLINSQDNDEVPSNIDMQLNFNGGGLDVPGGHMTINGSHTELNMTGGELNADTLAVNELSAGIVDMNLSGTTGVVTGLTQISLTENSETHIKLENGADLEWARTTGQTHLGINGDVNLDILGGSVLNSGNTLAAFIPDAEVTVDVDNSTWETKDLLLGGGGDTEVTARNGSHLKSDKVVVGVLPGPAQNSATVTLEGGSDWKAGALFEVGQSGAGEVTVKEGSEIKVEGQVVMAELEHSIADMEVSDGGRVESGTTFEVGRSGDALLTVEDGGVVISKGDAFVGTFENGMGEIRLKGQGSRFETEGNLNIGNGAPGISGDNGQGKVTVEDGAELKIGELKELRIGRRQGTVGELTLSGAETKLTGGTGTVQGISAGLDGTGKLNLEQGFKLINEDLSLSLGVNEKAVGILSAKGTATELQLATVRVGMDGRADALLQEGAKAVLSEGLVIGANNKNQQSVFTVTGQDTTLEVDGDVIVGDKGSGRLTLADGAHGIFDEGKIILGNQKDSAGVFELRGAGTQIEGDSELVIGERGTGSLNIAEGAEFEMESLALSRNEDSAGNITVSGEGSVLEIKKEAVFGEVFFGGALVDEKGTLKTGTNATGGTEHVTILGKNSGSTANAGVHGEGSQWIASSNVRVGDEGEGNLDILNSGKFTAEKDLTLGRSAGGEGRLAVKGRDSEVIYDTLHVGAGGFGALTVEDGAVLRGKENNTRVIMAGEDDGHNGFGSISLKGEGSKWLINGSQGLTIGQSGEGFVTLEDGASAEMKAGSELALGASGGTKGTLTVSGGSGGPPIFKASQFLTGNEVRIGVEGQGELTIRGGAEMKAAGDASNLETHVGTTSGGRGNVLVTGDDSTWETGNLTVGGEGAGRVEVQDGAVVKSKDVVVHSQAVLPALADVQGSKWTMDKLEVGGGGSAAFKQNSSLEITSGATVALKVGGSGSSAYLLIEDSKLDAQSAVQIGNNGTLEGRGAAITFHDDLLVGGEALLDNSALSAKNITVGTGSGLLKTVNGGSAHAAQELKIKGQGVVDAKGGSVTVGSGPEAGTSGAVEVQAGGVLSGDGLIVGNLLVQGVPSGNFGTGGKVKPGNSPGTLTIDGDFLLKAGAVLELEVAGTGDGLYDFLKVMGEATFEPGSIIDLMFVSGFAPKQGDVFSFLDAGLGLNFVPGSVQFNVSGLAPGFLFDADFTNGGLSLTALNNAVAAPEPGTLFLLAIGFFCMTVAEKIKHQNSRGPVRLKPNVSLSPAGVFK